MDLEWSDWDPSEECDGDRGEDLAAIGACADENSLDGTEWGCIVWRHVERGWIASIWDHAGAGSNEPREECVDSLCHGKAVCEREWLRELLARVRAIVTGECGR